MELPRHGPPSMAVMLNMTDSTDGYFLHPTQFLSFCLMQSVACDLGTHKHFLAR